MKNKTESNRPNLIVSRSLKHIYAQIVDQNGQVLVSASDLKISEKKPKAEISYLVGQNIGKKAIEAGIKKVSFGKTSLRYLGRVKKVAEGARSAGLDF